MKIITVRNKLLTKINKLTSLFSNSIQLDSREFLNKNILSFITAKEIQTQIDNLNNAKQIKNSFFHNTYIKEILVYIDKPLEFHNCEFDIIITNPLEMNFFKHHSFKNCVLYYSTTLFNTTDSTIFEDIIKAGGCTGIKLINKPYAYSILKKKNRNNEDFRMLHIDNCDLSNFNLPKDKNFFKNLANNKIENVKFPKLNLEDYDISNIHYINCEFESNSIIPHKYLNTNFKNCILPIIHFKSNINYKIESCSLHEESSFPKDENFFINSSFKECTMPKKDYSFYKIDKFSFEKCNFHKEAILPKDIFKAENSNILLTLSNIPDNVIGKIAQYTYIKEKDTFLNKYNHILSIEERFLLENLNY